jgi:hypothetical protein
MLELIERNIREFGYHVRCARELRRNCANFGAFPGQERV